MPLYCPSCAVQLEFDTRECGHCGADFTHPEGWRPVGHAGTPDGLSIAGRLNARIDFSADDRIAQVRMEAGSYVQSNGSFFVAGLVLMALLLLTQNVLFFRIMAGVLLVFAVVCWREVSKAADRSDSTVEIDKASRTVRRTIGRESTSWNVGSFREIQLYKVDPPGRGNSHQHGLQLVCDIGIVRLFTVHSADHAHGLALQLSDWLGVPLVDQGLVSFTRVVDRKRLL